MCWLISVCLDLSFGLYLADRKHGRRDTRKEVMLFFLLPSSLSCIFWKWLTSFIKMVLDRQSLHHASTTVLVTNCLALPGGDYGFPLLLVCRPHHPLLIPLNSGKLVNVQCLAISMGLNTYTMTDFSIPIWNYWMQY